MNNEINTDSNFSKNDILTYIYSELDKREDRIKYWKKCINQKKEDLKAVIDSDEVFLY